MSLEREVYGSLTDDMLLKLMTSGHPRTSRRAEMEYNRRHPNVCTKCGQEMPDE